MEGAARAQAAPTAAGRNGPDAAFWAGRRVLLTGHTGFKGCWLLLWLERLGARVSGLSLAPLDASPSLYDLVFDARHPSREAGFVDLRDAAAVAMRVRESEPEVVLHLAAQALVRPSYADPVGTYATNVMGTVHLLEAVRRTPSVRLVVVVTSDKVYENREWPWPYRETEALGGYDPYSSSKGCAELVTAAYRNSFLRDDGVRLASARAGNVIGGGDWSRDRLLPDLVRAFSSGTAVDIRFPDAVRPWQHVLEPLAGYLMLAERLGSADGAAFAQAWNFGPGDEDCWPVRDVVEGAVRHWGEGAAWRMGDAPRPHEAGFLKVDSSKARALLGWNRRLRLDEALRWTIAWYRGQLAGGEARALVAAQIEAYERLAG